jgi:hypothetical protein
MAVALVAMLMAFALRAGAAEAVGPPQALILSDSVSAGLPLAKGLPGATSNQSLEEYEAVQDGFVPTVVDGTTWDSMTASQFAQYQVVIIGDPTCDYSGNQFAAAVANASTWEPVVMGSGGNKVLIGTDPVYHWYFGSGPNADRLVGQGIAYAGAVAGATGAYVDLSCTYSTSSTDTPVPLLDGLSTHGPGSFTVGGAPCAGSIALVAATGPTNGLSDSDLSNWSCSVHEFFDHFPADYTPLALATDPSVPVTYTGTDVTTGGSVSGSPYIMLSGGGISITSNLTVSPLSQTLDTGTSGTVTGNLQLGGAPAPGASVEFDVTSGPDTGQTFTGTTDASGNVPFTYMNNGTAGTDQIVATTTNDGITSQGTASITWTPPTTGATGTTLATSLTGGGTTGVSLTVPSGTAVTDSSLLSGTNAGSAGGTVTYNVYSDSACTNLVSGPDTQSISTPGTMPSSASVTLTTPGTYYWTATYSGDANNQASSSSCGSETVTVTPTPQPTDLQTVLSGGGNTNTQLIVPDNASVSDTATLAGANAATAGGTVTYNVYSDPSCLDLISSSTVNVTNGSVPNSAPVSFGTGTYYWSASYSGDASNDASTEGCGNEIQIVLSGARFGADVGVQLEVIPGTMIQAGSTYVICLVVTNYGPKTANNIFSGLLLPKGLSLVDPNGAKVIGKFLLWKTGTFTPGETITYHVWVNPAAGASGTGMLDGGALSLATLDPNYHNNFASDALMFMGKRHLKVRASSSRTGSGVMLARLRTLGRSWRAHNAHRS